MSDSTYSDEYCISSGVFQEMCHTTRDTLRYYHKQGILVPKKNEQNGYYYYSHAQIGSFYFIKVFRDLGCSIDQIKLELLSGKETSFDTFYELQQKKLLQQKNELQKKINVLNQSRELLAFIRSIDGQGPSIIAMPKPYKLHTTPITDQNAYSIREASSFLRTHHDHYHLPEYQAFPIGVSIKWNDFMNSNYRYDSLFSFAAQTSKEKALPSALMLVDVYKESYGTIEKNYSDMKNYIEKHNLKVLSDFYSLSIVNVIDPLVRRKYLKYLFICIEENIS